MCFSFGQSAIFLLGGNSIEEAALPIFLHSGDIIVMSSQARLLYHGIPRIVHIEGYSPWENTEKFQNTIGSNNFDFREKSGETDVYDRDSRVDKKCVYLSCLLYTSRCV